MAGYPPPRFAGRAENDLDDFIKNYRLYLTAARITTNNAAGKQRALALWQSCLTGDAANWRETKIAGKKFRLNHVSRVRIGSVIYRTETDLPNQLE